MQILSGSTKPTVALALTPDGARLFSVGRGLRTIRDWNLASGELAAEHKGAHRDAIEGLLVTPDGRHLISASSETVVVRPMGGSPRPLATTPNQRLWRGSLAFDHRDGLVFAPCNGEGCCYQSWS